MRSLVLGFGGFLILTTFAFALEPPKNGRRAKDTQGRVYTEEDAKRARGSVTSLTIDKDDKVDQKTSSTPTSSDEESTWRSRFAAAEGKVKSLGQEIAVLDLKLKKMNTEWHYTGARGGDLTASLPIAKQMNDTTEQLNQKKAELDKALQELESLRAKARQASIPPGWMRGNSPAATDDPTVRISQTKDKNNDLELELNNLRNKLNSEMMDSQREAIQKQIDQKTAEIKANKDKIDKLQVEAKQKAMENEPPEEKRDEAYWKNKLQSLQKKTTELESRRKALQESTGYPRYAGFTASDDTREELQKIQKELTETQQEIERIKRTIK